MIREGSNVKWKWGGGTAQGKVKETFASKITRTIDGSEITRNGEEGNKVLLIEQEDGSQVLKLEDEVTKSE